MTTNAKCCYDCEENAFVIVKTDLERKSRNIVPVHSGFVIRPINTTLSPAIDGGWEEREKTELLNSFSLLEST